MLIMQRLPEYHLLRPYFDVEHVFGPANIMADAASRAKFKLIATLAVHLGVTARRISLPERALTFFRDACAAVRALGEGAGNPAKRRKAHSGFGVEAVPVTTTLAMPPTTATRSN